MWQKMDVGARDNGHDLVILMNAPFSVMHDERQLRRAEQQSRNVPGVVDKSLTWLDLGNHWR